MSETIAVILESSKAESITFARIDETGKFRCEITWANGSVNRRTAKTPEAALNAISRLVA